MVMREMFGVCTSVWFIDGMMHGGGMYSAIAAVVSSDFSISFSAAAVILSSRSWRRIALFVPFGISLFLSTCWIAFSADSSDSCVDVAVMLRLLRNSISAQALRMFTFASARSVIDVCAMHVSFATHNASAAIALSNMRRSDCCWTSRWTALLRDCTSMLLFALN